ELPYPTRFSWPMRIFLSVFLAFLVFRTTSVLYPWRKWAEKLKVSRNPGTAPPSRGEQAGILPDPDRGGRAALREPWFKSLDSLWLYARPWPGPDERTNLQSGTDFLKWYLIFANSRLGFIENAIGFDQEWPMYSPSVGTETTIPRARLIYS